MRTAEKLVAIVVPVSNRPNFTPDEEKSCEHLIHHLGRYEKYLVAPPGLEIHRTGFEVRRFPSKYFGSVVAHNKLMMSTEFYRSFSDYQYILIYHLDALVFSDQLMQWCRAGFDFIGAPWIKHEDAPYAGNAVYEDKVGNGGFSLRKVDSFLKVLNSQRLQVDPEAYWKKNYGGKPALVRLLNLPKRYLKRLSRFNGVRTEIDRMRGFWNEEYFWSNRAAHYYPDFKIAPVEAALRFSFECVPRYCYARNGHQLPFGCHAWQRYDREFWMPFLLGASESEVQR